MDNEITILNEATISIPGVYKQSHMLDAAARAAPLMLQTPAAPQAMRRATGAGRDTRPQAALLHAR